MEHITRLFEGRLGRRHWVLSFLLLVGASIVVAIISSIISGMSAPLAQLISFICMLAISIVQLSIHARRYHDTGKSGWFALLMLIPIVNIIAFIILCFDAGDEGDNAYGSRPSPTTPILEVMLKRKFGKEAEATVVTPEPPISPVPPQQ